MKKYYDMSGKELDREILNVKHSIDEFSHDLAAYDKKSLMYYLYLTSTLKSLRKKYNKLVALKKERLIF